MTPEERRQVLDLCKRLRDEQDQEQIIVLADELNRLLDNAMSRPKAKAKYAAGG